MKTSVQQENPGRWAAASLAARVLLGCVFIYSGFDKAVAPPQEFAAVIDSYYLLSPDYPLSPDVVLSIAAVLPWLELIFGTFLLAGYLTRLSAFILGGMLLAFIFALMSVKMRGVPLENCGCFGSSLHVPPAFGILLDILMASLAFLALKHGRRRSSLDNWVDAGTG